MEFDTIIGPMLKDYSNIKVNNLCVYYKNGNLNHARLTLQTLSEAYTALSGYFNFNIDKEIRSILTPARKEYERLVTGLLGVNIEIPSNPGRVAQPQRTDIVFLCPSAYNKHSIYTYVPSQYKMMIYHELTHVFEEAMSPNIETLPRWWSEGLAVYLSGQWKYNDQFNFRLPAVIGLKNRQIPDLCEIDESIALSYEWGWTIVLFIEDFYSRETLVKIVKECEDGNIVKLLGQNNCSFEKKYRNWLSERGKDLILTVS